MQESLAVVRYACLSAAVGLPLLLVAPAQGAAEVPGWARNTIWADAMDWASARLADCKALADRELAVACEGFTAEALAEIYAIDEFLRGDERPTGRQILERLERADSGWVLLGPASEQQALEAAQARANDGLPVVAAYAGGWRGHAALVLPGSGYPSQTWGLRVPNSASFFASRAERSYIGKSLSFAFGKDIKDRVMIYYRPRLEDAEGPAQEAATEPAPTPEPATAPENTAHETPPEENPAETAAQASQPPAETGPEGTSPEGIADASARPETAPEAAPETVEETATETAPSEPAEATVALAPPEEAEPVGGDQPPVAPAAEEIGVTLAIGAEEEPLSSDPQRGESLGEAQRDAEASTGRTGAEPQIAALPERADSAGLVATDGEAYRILKDQMAGTWCAVGESDTDKLRAFLINPEALLLSRGEIDLREPVSFRSLDSQVIVDVKGDAEIIGITYARKNRMSDAMTAFFVLNSRNRMFESHVFDAANNRILDRGDTWERCSDQYALPRPRGAGSG